MFFLFLLFEIFGGFYFLFPPVLQKLPFYRKSSVLPVVALPPHLLGGDEAVILTVPVKKIRLGYCVGLSLPFLLPFFEGGQAPPRSSS